MTCRPMPTTAKMMAIRTHVRRASEWLPSTLRWSRSAAAREIAGHVAFYPDRSEITVDPA